jgi:hypothetical protein
MQKPQMKVRDGAAEEKERARRRGGNTEHAGSGNAAKGEEPVGRRRYKMGRRFADQSKGAARAYKKRERYCRGGDAAVATALALKRITPVWSV